MNRPVSIRRVATIGSALVVAAIAAYASYSHMRHLALTYGQDQAVATMLPISVDGMMVVATLALGDGRQNRWSAWLAFWTGVAASVVANVLAAEPSVIARCISAWPAIAFLLVVEVITRGGRIRVTEPVTEAATPVTSPADVTAAVPAIGAVPVPTAEVPAVPAPIGTPARTRTAKVKRARTGTTTKAGTAQKPGTRTDAELTEALAAVPRDDDGTVPVRRAASALGTGPDRARRLLADAGLLRTEPDAEPDTKPVNGHAVPELALTAGVQS